MCCFWWRFGFTFIPHPLRRNFHSWLTVCLFVGVYLYISEPHCWAGQGHRGFSNGVGGLCFVAQSSKSCLSVLSSWTSCNNTYGPLNRLLCCAALAWVTSITCTLAQPEMRPWWISLAEMHAHKWTLKRVYSHSCECRCTDPPLITDTHRNTQQILSLDHD